MAKTGNKVIELVLGILSEAGLCFEMLHPASFWNTSFITEIIGTVFVRISVLIMMIGLAVMMVAAFLKNAGSLCNIAFFIMFCHVFVVLLSVLPTDRFRSMVRLGEADIKVFVFLVVMLFAAFAFAFLLLRGVGVFSPNYGILPVLIIIAVGQFVLNGILAGWSDFFKTPFYFIAGLSAAMPYIALSFFEKWLHAHFFFK